MHITSAQQAISAGLVKVAEEKVVSGSAIDWCDLIVANNCVYRVIGTPAPASSVVHAIRTRNERDCRGTHYTDLDIADCHHLMADITAMNGIRLRVCKVRRKWHPEHKLGVSTVPGWWEYIYDHAWCSNPDEVRAFVKGASKAYIYIGMGRALIPLSS